MSEEFPLYPTAPNSLTTAKIKVQLYRNRVRISPSVYNDMADIEQLLRVVASVA
jgi:selenocysteine lyase/cysteine desulfurase